MKVIINGKEEELIDELEPGEKELDMWIPKTEEATIDLENTIEITDDMIQDLNNPTGDEFNE